MGTKYTNDYVLEGALVRVAESTRMHVCSGASAPASYAAAVSASLADVDLTPGNGNGDYTFANGDVSGRKCTVAQQSAITIDASGDASHIALVDVANSRLNQVTTCNVQALTAGNTVTVPPYDVEFLDVTQ